MRDLDAVLHRAGDVELSPTDTDELAHQVQRSRQARRAGILATGAALSLALVGALLALSERDPSRINVASAGENDAGPTALPSRWEQRSWPADATAIERVVTVGGKTLAVGSLGSPDGGMRPAIWVGHPDDWTLAHADAPVPSINHGRVSDVTHFKGRFFAVGERLPTASGDDAEVVAGVWTSSDGRIWRAIDDPSLAPPAPGRSGRASIARIVAGPEGLLAFGDTLDGSQVETNVVWSSKDGSSWSRAPLALPGAGPFSVVKSALRVGDDVVIAGSNGRGAAAWATRDGRSWRTLPVDPAAGAIIEGLAATGGRVVAVGTTSANDQPEALVWLMTDADGLKRASLDADAHGVARTDVAASPAGFLIAGWRGSGESPSAVAWTSADGRTWRAIARDGTVFQHGALATATGVAGDHFVIVGATVAVSKDPRLSDVPRWDGSSVLWYSES